MLGGSAGRAIAASVLRVRPTSAAHHRLRPRAPQGHEQRQSPHPRLVVLPCGDEQRVLLARLQAKARNRHLAGQCAPQDPIGEGLDAQGELGAGKRLLQPPVHQQV